MKAGINFPAVTKAERTFPAPQRCVPPPGAAPAGQRDAKRGWELPPGPPCPQQRHSLRAFFSYSRANNNGGFSRI